MRDARSYAEAAEAYRAVLAVAPERTDIRVQHGNMLKDSGRLAEAESAYRAALADRPDEPDIHLQLAHCLKLQGRRAAALEAYGRAAQLAPFSLASQQELSQMGRHRNQEYLFEAQLRLGGVEAVMEVAHQVLQLRAMLSRLIETLPDIQAQMAFPIGCYDHFREVYDIPPPPQILASRSFAILLLADREALEIIRAQITAVRSQTYERWKLYMLGMDPARRRVAEEAAATDPRIVWSETSPNETSTQAEQRIALSARADWIVLLAERALLHPRAIEWFASAVDYGAATAFVADQETGMHVRGLLRRTSPELRQVVDYDSLLEMNTFGETVAVESSTFATLAHKLTAVCVSSARSSLLLALARNGRVGHIPCPLVCIDGHVSVDPVRSAAAHEEAVRAHLAEAGLAARVEVIPRTGPPRRSPIVWRPRNPEEPIAVIIPTRDNGPDVKRFVESLREKAAVPDALGVLIVDNGSRQAQTRAILEALVAEKWAQVLMIDEPFNWSRLNNRAVETVGSSLLVFANDDMVMRSDRWDERLRGLLDRPEIGAVGARLLYEDNTVQHAGILFGWKGSEIHDGLYESCLEPGPASRWHVTRAVAAVTGAFLATRREIFLAHRGFDEVGLPVACSDTDYALKLRASGLRILWTPDITLYHHESKTRGLDRLDPEKRARSAAERAVLKTRWGTALDADPSLNPMWHMATQPFRLVSAPSRARLWAHIERCAATNPWWPGMGVSARDNGVAF